MSDQQTGGDGSVRWSVDADNVKPGDHEDSDKGGGKRHQHGVDQSGDVGDWFTVSIKVPAEIGDTNAYLAALRGDDARWGIKRDPNGPSARIYFNLRIERKTPDQIRVSWGDSANVLRPQAAQANLRTPGANRRPISGKGASSRPKPSARKASSGRKPVTKNKRVTTNKAVRRRGR